MAVAYEIWSRYKAIDSSLPLNAEAFSAKAFGCKDNVLTTHTFRFSLFVFHSFLMYAAILDAFLAGSHAASVPMINTVMPTISKSIHRNSIG